VDAKIRARADRAVRSTAQAALTAQWHLIGFANFRTTGRAVSALVLAHV
jgi:hypothetical protein